MDDGLFGLTTFILTLLFLPPLVALAVIVMVPSFLGLTAPDEVTVAIFLSEELHLIVERAVTGESVADNFKVLP